MDKCLNCGHSFKKQYCQCKNLSVFDLLCVLDADYCRKCNKEIKQIKAQLILSNPFGDGK